MPVHASSPFCEHIHPFNGFPSVFSALWLQIDHYAQRDLKKGLQLFGTEGNVGLTNAWMIVQTDVRIERKKTQKCSFYSHHGVMTLGKKLYNHYVQQCLSCQLR